MVPAIIVFFIITILTIFILGLHSLYPSVNLTISLIDLKSWLPPPCPLINPTLLESIPGRENPMATWPSRWHPLTATSPRCHAPYLVRCGHPTLLQFHRWNFEDASLPYSLPEVLSVLQQSTHASPPPGSLPKPPLSKDGVRSHGCWFHTIFLVALTESSRCFLTWCLKCSRSWT